MKNALKRLNPALPGLILGILLYSIPVEIAGLLLSGDRLRFTSGLCVGTACAVGMAVHIASVLAASVSQGGYSRRMSVLSVVRYLVVAAVLFIMLYLNAGDLIAAFLGIFGLKVSAYAQPRLNRIGIFARLAG